MSASAIFITDQKGKILISRNYRGDIPMSVSSKFSEFLTKEDTFGRFPIIVEDGITYIQISHYNLYLLAITKRNANAMLILCFLYRLVEVFEDYFNKLEEESIRDNFVLIYELLDEMMDFGYPQTTEAKVLKDFICVMEKHLIDIRPPDTVTNAVSQRSQGIRHKKNEVFLDVVEKLNLLVAGNGTVLHSEILGSLKMKSYLSGMPELKLGLNDKLIFQHRRRAGLRGKMIEMDDIRFHQCVRLARFENDRTISFIPPDGEFELMSYRLDTKVKPLIQIEAHVEPHSHSRIEYMIKAKSEFKRRSSANNVEIIVPVPGDADSPIFKTSVGTVVYVPENNTLVQSIKQFQGQREFIMRAHFGLPSISANDDRPIEKPPVRVHFEIPYFTVSGIQVRYLKIIEKSGYQALPWVRYITQHGDYQLRIA